MGILSLKFVLFVLLSLLVYYLLPGKVQNLFLLLASYVFYATWARWFAIPLIAISLFNYYYAHLVQHSLLRSQGARRWILWGGVGLNSAVLLGFLLGSLLNPQINNWIERFGPAHIVIAILLPLGFSYRVLECISYLIDIHLKIATASTNFIDFALYLAYFPKLISGPIERARKFLPLIASQRSVDNQALARSLMLILVGLVQSVMLAGMLSVLMPATVLDQPQSFSAAELLMGIPVFLFYLYNQFAGYTHIVRGVSGLFGIELSRNFLYPFFSKDFSDYWKRWHISLSQWLRDYIYLPLSRSLLRRNPSRTNKANLVLPPLVTMLVSGLWHGASLHLLVWGLVTGSYIIAENIFSLFRSTRPGAKTPLWRQATSSLVVFGLVMLAVIPFRLDLTTSKVFIYRLIFAWDGRLPDLRPLVFIGLSLLLDWLQFRHGDENVFLKWPGWLQAFSTALVILAVIIVSNLQNAPATFTYP